MKSGPAPRLNQSKREPVAQRLPDADRRFFAWKTKGGALEKRKKPAPDGVGASGRVAVHELPLAARWCLQLR